MTTGVFTAIAITGFTVAFLHAAIPTHWLPFVVAARAQHWNSAKTLVVTGIAGSGHVLFTTALGVVVAWGGIAINAKWSRTFPLIAGGALIVVGLFYLVSRLKGSHGHVHLFGGPVHHERHQHHDDAHLHGHHAHDDLDHRHHHEHEEIEKIEHQWSRPRSDWTVIAGLVALLTFSPCEAFLPVFLTGAKYRLVRLCIAQRNPRHCNRCGDDCIYVADSPRTATSPIQGAREIRADYRRRGVLFTRPDHHPV